MENIVNVEGTELDVREYNGQMVVTFDDIDLVIKDQVARLEKRLIETKALYKWR